MYVEVITLHFKRKSFIIQRDMDIFGETVKKELWIICTYSSSNFQKIESNSLQIENDIRS